MALHPTASRVCCSCRQLRVCPSRSLQSCCMLEMCFVPSWLCSFFQHATWMTTRMDCRCTRMQIPCTLWPGAHIGMRVLRLRSLPLRQLSHHLSIRSRRRRRRRRKRRRRKSSSSRRRICKMEAILPLALTSSSQLPPRHRTHHRLELWLARHPVMPSSSTTKRRWLQKICPPPPPPPPPPPSMCHTTRMCRMCRRLCPTRMACVLRATKRRHRSVCTDATSGLSTARVGILPPHG
mmetsp:Transcript_5287/g.12107  ORF Transcript_5287/g.12107 Transcript_5287/m.12107 type:complete len:236 (+) Transcript_5287:146-853(+)